MSARTARLIFVAVVLLSTVAALSAAAPVALAATVSCQLSRSSLVYGERVTVSGAVEPVAEGEQVTVALDDVTIETLATDAAGAFTLTFAPPQGGSVSVSLADGTASEAMPLTVRPAVRISHGTPQPFLSTTFTLRVSPAAYTGQVTVSVSHRGREVATLKGTAQDGRAALKVPLRGIESFSLRFTLAAWEGLASRSVSHRVSVAWRSLAYGSKGPAVRGVLYRLAALKVRTPGNGDSFTRAVGDAVVAFQKAYGLSRDYRVDYQDWRRLETAAKPRPHFASPLTHIEIDKGRQILSVVRDGSVIGVVAVSTGKTGNTPTGSHFIQRKIPVNTLFGGRVVMPRFMTFYKTQGIHGYPSVPPYPASHGCVREPLWVCDWVYDRSFIGERVYIHP